MGHAATIVIIERWMSEALSEPHVGTVLVTSFDGYRSETSVCDACATYRRLRRIHDWLKRK